MLQREMTIDLAWKPTLNPASRPLYRAIADAIEEDVRSGRLGPGAQLPTQRELAATLRLNYTTVARAYSEARTRGLIEGRTGAGTFVRASPEHSGQRAPRRDLSDRSMNQPPEPSSAELIARRKASWDSLGHDLTAMMRYQPPGGSAEDKAAALRWLSRRGIEASADHLLIAPGSHAAMLAILSAVVDRREVVCCEPVTYPGLNAIAKSLGLQVHSLPEDASGVLPDAFASFAATGDVRVLYLNPTLRNPTTHTVPAQRRAELIEVARRFGVFILEDDAYGHLKPSGPPPIAMLAPDLTYYICGLAKTLGAGLRLAYLLTPSRARRDHVLARLKIASVMASPVTTALATRWIETGLADDMLSAVRAEIRARQAMAIEALSPEMYRSDRDAFHLWLRPPDGWTRTRVVDWMRGYALGAVASDPFCIDAEPIEAVRLCLGGAATQGDVQSALQALAQIYR